MTCHSEGGSGVMTPSQLDAIEGNLGKYRNNEEIACMDVEIRRCWAILYQHHWTWSKKLDGMRPCACGHAYSGDAFREYCPAAHQTALASSK